MLWLAASGFGEEGRYALKQLRKSALQSWLLGVEDGNVEGFPVSYINWCKNAQ